jgi:glycosyltransferase involved in cell wall biosynthesis
MIDLSHLTGNQNVRAALSGLDQAELLSMFHVSIAIFPDDLLDRVGRFGSFSELRRRSFSGSFAPRTITAPAYEAARLLLTKAGVNQMVGSDDAPFSVYRGYKYLDRKVAGRLPKAVQKGTKAIYAYEDGALTSFREAERLGMLKLYDLPIGYWREARTLMNSALEQWPEWATTIQGFSDSEEKTSRKEEEIRLADHIFVASSFTAKTLEAYPGKLPPVTVIPYGFPPVYTNRTYDVLTNRPIKLLFVGGLSQRKGLAELFQAVDRLGDRVSLTVVGRKSAEHCKVLEEALAKHNYIPSLPHNEILGLMRQHDLFVFPSLFEGFGLVITEAMSQGTPVITTDRTAGPDIITDGKDGWIVPAGSVDDLYERLRYLVEHPVEIERAGREALETASKRPWSSYGDELAEAVKAIVA